MPGLGDEFRVAREARHLSLSDVSKELHVRLLYLQSIEREEWGSIGAAVYVGGFIRTYACFLGIDPQRAIADFKASCPAPDPATRYAASTAPSAASHKAPAASRASPWPMVAGLVAFAWIAFVGYAYYRVQGNNRPPFTAGVTATSAASAVAANAPAPTASLTPALLIKPSRRPLPAPSRTIELRLTDRSWLRVDVDGAKALEGIFPAGTRKYFHGRSVYVRTGNAGGVEVVVNGKDEGTMGHQGDVVERTFTLARE
jgi:cytoskeleton protein RodZ